MSLAILLIAHGSRRPAANADLVQLADLLRQKSLAPIIAHAYLELADPTTPTAVTACIAQGATRIPLFPYFLSPGAHVVRDLEKFRQEFTQQYPGITFELSPPLGLHPLMLDIVQARLQESPLSDTP